MKKYIDIPGVGRVQEGSRVVVDKCGEETVGTVASIWPKGYSDPIRMVTGGMFKEDGQFNIGPWKIVRLAWGEDLNLRPY